MLAISLGMGTATFVGAVSGLVPIVHLLVLAAAGFLAGLLVAAGRGATQVGVNAMIALLVFGRLTAYPGPAAVHASWVLAGGLFQTLLAVLVRSPRPSRSQRVALADAYELLAEAAARDEQVPIAVAEAAAAAREAIGRWLQADDRPMAGPCAASPTCYPGDGPPLLLGTGCGGREAGTGGANLVYQAAWSNSNLGESVNR